MINDGYEMLKKVRKWGGEEVKIKNGKLKIENDSKNGQWCVLLELLLVVIDLFDRTAFAIRYGKTTFQASQCLPNLGSI